MAKLISASIDLTKIDKSRIVKGKNNQLYYNITISVNDEKNQYGQDVSITQEQTKDDRENKVDKIYLGNGKIVWTNENQSSSTGVPKQAVDEWANDLTNDLFF